ncbi:hypothetical protein TNCV_4931751 [Trichonephila clavipes]|nr:hypothetical protein TNCV_4931751 [Trichonephila clavipes]
MFGLLSHDEFFIVSMELTFFPDRKPHPIPPTEYVWALFGCAVKRTLQAHAAEELESAAGSRISPDIIHYLIDSMPHTGYIPVYLPMETTLNTEQMVL